jgi:hypothetical protein
MWEDARPASRNGGNRANRFIFNDLFGTFVSAICSSVQVAYGGELRMPDTDKGHESDRGDSEVFVHVRMMLRKLKAFIDQPSAQPEASVTPRSDAGQDDS